MATIPDDLALATIPDGGAIQASPHRNNYSALQTAFNAVLDFLKSGTLGQVLTSGGPTAMTWAGGLPAGVGLLITAAGTITVTNKVHHVTGATTINNIAGGTNGDILTLIVANGQTMTLGGAGNIFTMTSGSNRTVGANAAVTLVFDSQWYVAGVGS